MTWYTAAKPAEWADLSTTKRSDIFELGETVLLTLSQSVPSGTYEVRNIEGTIVASGALSGTSLTLSGLGCGWYNVLLSSPTSIADFGTARGEMQLTIVQPDARFPANPARGTAGRAAGVAFDGPTRGVFGLGPHRHFIQDCANPTVANGSGDGSIAKCSEDADSEVTYWQTIAEPNRAPKELLVHLTGWQNIASHITGARTVVAGLYPKIKWFEFTNEPQGITASTVATDFQAFADAIHAENVNAKALGPNPVSINLQSSAWIDAFYAALGTAGRAKLDGLSYHWYNSVGSGGGDLALTLRSLRLLASIHAKYPDLAGKPLWQTEQGYYGATWGAFSPRMQAKWASIRMIVPEQFGFVTERDHVWIGDFTFFDEPMYQRNIANQMLPEAALYRTFVAERFNKTFTSKYDFGADHENQLVGSLYTNATTGDKMAVFLNGGYPEDGRPSIKLGVKGASTVTKVDAWGNTSTLTADSRGQVTVTVPEVPVYLRLPNGVTAEFQGTRLGADYAKNGHTGARITTTPVGSLTKAQKINGTGQFDSSYYASNASVSHDMFPWETTTLPAECTITFLNPLRIDTVRVEFAPPWQWQATSLQHKVQATADGTTWFDAATVAARNTKAFSRRSPGDQSASAAHEYWDRAHIFEHAIPRDTYKAVKVVVQDTSIGGYPTAAVQAALGTDNGADQAVKRACIRGVQAFCSDTTSERLVKAL